MPDTMYIDFTNSKMAMNLLDTHISVTTPASNVWNSQIKTRYKYVSDLENRFTFIRLKCFVKPF